MFLVAITDDNENEILNNFFFLFLRHFGGCIPRGSGKWHLLLTGLFHFVLESFPIQLVVRAGSNFEGFAREKYIAKFPEIDPRFDEIRLFGPNFNFSRNFAPS